MSPNTVVVNWEMRVPSRANMRASRAIVEHGRVKQMRRRVSLALLAHISATIRGELAAASSMKKTFDVTFIRRAPRRLDPDNLAFAFKAIQDEVARFLCVNDGSERFRPKYQQEKLTGQAPQVGLIIDWED